MRIGIDLGGHENRRLVLDKGGVERERLRIPTPATSYEEDVEAILGVIAELERKGRPTLYDRHRPIPEPSRRPTGLIKKRQLDTTETAAP